MLALTLSHQSPPHITTCLPPYAAQSVRAAFLPAAQCAAPHDQHPAAGHGRSVQGHQPSQQHWAVALVTGTGNRWRGGDVFPCFIGAWAGRNLFLGTQLWWLRQPAPYLSDCTRLIRPQDTRAESCRMHLPHRCPLLVRLLPLPHPATCTVHVHRTCVFHSLPAAALAAAKPGVAGFLRCCEAHHPRKSPSRL